MVSIKDFRVVLFRAMVFAVVIIGSINGMNEEKRKEEGRKSLHDSKKSLIPHLKKSGNNLKTSKSDLDKKVEKASKKNRRHSGHKNIPVKEEKELIMELTIQKESSSVQSSPMGNNASLKLSGFGLRPKKNSGSGSLISVSEFEEIDTYNPMVLAITINNYLHDGELSKVKEILKNPVCAEQIKNFKLYDEQSGDSEGIRSFNQNISLAQQIIQQNEEQDSWDDLTHLDELLFFKTNKK